jgi:6,7-dimethyl-8-ribityllumazine synthase
VSERFAEVQAVARAAREAVAARTQGDPAPEGARERYAIAVGRFYEDLAERLVNSARAAFAKAGHDEDIEVFDVPGAYELPLAAKYAAESGRFAGVACLGAVIRGETDHYDFVCAETARGVMQVQLDTGVPCAFGVLTCATMEQALARAGGDRSRETPASGGNPRFGQRDTGRHAAEAVLRMAALRRELGGR